jgi:hypothetical protein
VLTVAEARKIRTRGRGGVLQACGDRLAQVTVAWEQLTALFGWERLDAHRV